MFKRKRLYGILVLTVLLTLVGCSNKTQTLNLDNGKIKVYTSFYAMYDFTNKIGGDKIELVNMVPAGIEPHDWEPSPEDIINLENADVFIYNGAGMESWVEKVLASIENKDLIVVEASNGLSLIEGSHSHEDEDVEDNDESDHDESEKYDPHVWLNPMLAKQQTEKIMDALILADPVNKVYYEENYSKYSQEFDLLNQEYITALSNIKNRDIVVTHQAYGYICDAYNLNQIAIEGLNPYSDPSPARMAEIIEFAHINNIKVIFFEELVSSKVAETIANEIGAKTAVLNPIGGLKEEDIIDGKDYFSVMRDNLQALKEALNQ